MTILMVIGAVALASAKGDTFVLASVGTAVNPNQKNSSGATIPVTKNGSWATALTGSSWVSFAPTGDAANPGFKAVPMGTVVSFIDEFKIAGTATYGALRVMADDTATVILNGTVIYAEGSPNGNTYETCSDTGIGCLAAVTINIPANLLHRGSNKLEFRVRQRGGGSFGLDYTGTVNFAPTSGFINTVGFPNGRRNPISTPEPSSLALLSAGILALVALGLRLKK